MLFYFFFSSGESRKRNNKIRLYDSQGFTRKVFISVNSTFSDDYRHRAAAKRERERTTASVNKSELNIFILFLLFVFKMTCSHDEAFVEATAQKGKNN